jgi:hypothetical protein
MNYVVLLDYCIGEVIKIRLNPEQIAESENYNDFEEYLVTLEDEYGFRLSNCSRCLVSQLATQLPIDTSIAKGILNRNNVPKQPI